MDRTGVPPSSQTGTTPPRMEDHCIQPSARGRNMMMMMREGVGMECDLSCGNDNSKTTRQTFMKLKMWKDIGVF